MLLHWIPMLLHMLATESRMVVHVAVGAVIRGSLSTL